MIRKAIIRNQARKESYLRERRDSKKWSALNSWPHYKPGKSEIILGLDMFGRPMIKSVNYKIN